jgi:hypothetical protein
MPKAYLTFIEERIKIYKIMPALQGRLAEQTKKKRSRFHKPTLKKDQIHQKHLFYLESRLRIHLGFSKPTQQPRIGDSDC